MKTAAALIVVLAAACGVEASSVKAPQVDASEILRDPIDRFVASGKTAAAFAELADEIDRVDDTPGVADEASLRLLALAAPIVESTRTQALDAQIESLALTVWPSLIGDRAASNESAVQYVARQCDALPGCRALPEARRPLVVRAAAMHRAAAQMRTALDRCLHCGTDPTWASLGSRWESFDAQAMRALL